MNPLRIAFVGTGTMARNHLSALRLVRTPHAVVAVCDKDRGSAQEFADMTGATPYADFAHLLGEIKPDVVHVCTPAGRHFEPACAALVAGAHVYIEKPVVETAREATELFQLAASRGRLVCAGHQQLRDSACIALLRRLPELGTITRIDSHFAFHPVGMTPERPGPRALAKQLLDILPHPLSALIWTLERASLDSGCMELTSILAEPTDLHAIIRAGDCWGRLSVSLRARPVASTLTVTGTRGTVTADFMRGALIGAGNTGTAPLEKAANPIVEGWQMATGALRGVARRVKSGGYPGLAELVGDFYEAVARGGVSPFPPDHLQRVTGVYEDLAVNVLAAAERITVQRAPRSVPAPDAPLAVLTGARGFFGKEIARALALRGFRVRGVGRSTDPDDPSVHEWRAIDLSKPIPADVFIGAAVVIHAAAASSGGFEAHQRHTIDVTKNVLQAMGSAGCTRLVYVSSLSVLRPPRPIRNEYQDERTPLVPPDDRSFGPYTWGKTQAEHIVAHIALERALEIRIMRPAALVDAGSPELPGLVGKQLFGRWHLGFGRPALPFAMCEVRRAAEAIAWCAEQFDAAPRVTNLIDQTVSSRRALLQYFQARGWNGRVLWMPISLFAGLFTAARLGAGLVRLRVPPRLRVWSLFRPRRYQTAVADRVLAASSDVPSSADLGAQQTPVPWRA